MDAVAVAATQKLSSFSCEIRILEAKNIEFKSPKNLFVRYYLSAGNNKQRIRLNTRQISSVSDFIWNECFSLECLGSEESIHSLKQATVMFELRQANKTLPFVGRISGSQLLGKAEIPWEQVFGSPNMEIDKWVSLSSSLVCEEGFFKFKQPKLKVGMRVRVNYNDQMEKKRIRRFGKSNNDDDCICGCNSEIGNNNCPDHHFFAMAAAMEFL